MLALCHDLKAADYAQNYAGIIFTSLACVCWGGGNGMVIGMGRKGERRFLSNKTTLIRVYMNPISISNTEWLSKCAKCVIIFFSSEEGISRKDHTNNGDCT